MNNRAMEPESLKVAIFSESSLEHASGVTTSVLRIVDNLQDQGHEAMVVCPGPVSDTYNNAAVHGTPSVSLRGFRVGMISTPKAEGYVRDFEPDVIHNASPFGPLGASASKLRKPNVAVYQTNMPDYLKHYLGSSALTALAERRVAAIHNRSSITLAPSTTAVDDLVRFGVEKERIRLWGRGIDSVLFNPERAFSEEVQTLREQLSAEGKPIVGYIGRLAPEKSVGRLEQLKDLDAQVMIVGDGPERGRLQAKLGKKATFLGELRDEELANAYAACDIFAHTGTNETFGQTLQEALASGVPVVAPAVGGPLDIVQHGETGYLYNPDDDNEFRTSIDRLLKDPELRASMGSKGRQWVVPRSWSALTEDLVAHYRSIL